MNTININLEIDLANTKVAEALSNLILVMGGVSSTQQVSAQEQAPKIKAVKETPPIEKETAPLTIVKDEENVSDTNAQETPADTDSNTDKPVATLEEIREVLGKKVSDHREAIKAKLTELSAKNVSVLDAKHYDSFKAFLDKL